MKYSDLIKQEGEYNYSVNIQFDTEDDKKLQRFIPNETTIELLREYFVDITRDKPQQHSRILYGSYGTGKSHFLTVLYLLLSKQHLDGKGYKTFIRRIDEYDSRLAQDIEGYVSEPAKKPFLLVPIVFDFDDFDRCIYYSLRKKLDTIGKRVSFRTFFDQASLLLQQWESNPESEARLIEACRRTRVSLKILKRHLSTFDKKAEESFQKIFSEMTFGVKYIYEVSNLSETLDQAGREIQDEYAGIIFVFDEFGRYIEDNIKTIKVKSVQNLAEYCDHSSMNDHIILVSHKEISLYTQRIGKTLAAEWKKVEGRYKPTPINDKPDQCLSLIKNILIKEPKLWEQFAGENQWKLNKLYSEATDFRGFLLNSSSDENPFEGGFPLHPISLFALDKLSKKVAQNERTFFTYLVGREENSLYQFLKDTDLAEFHYVGLNEIYDYFEPSIKSVQSDDSYEWYKRLQTALAKCHYNENDNVPEVKILKSIATIGIINDSSSLRANKQTLLCAVDMPDELLANALSELSEKRIIKYSGAYGRYDFFEASVYDVESLINDGSSTVSDDAVVNTLNEEFVDFVLYPYEYNRQYKITRVFFPVFALPTDSMKKYNFGKIGQYYDGLLVMMLGGSEEDYNAIREISTKVSRSIVFANSNVANLKEAVRKYISIKYLFSTVAKYNEKDPAFEKELQYFREEIMMMIHGLIEDWKQSFNHDSVIISNGEDHPEIHTMLGLSELASKLMFDAYSSTLIVNNELINKNAVSSSIATAKKNVIISMLKGEDAVNYYGQKYLSPEYLAVRSVLAKNEFIQVDTQPDSNSCLSGVKPQYAVRKQLDMFIREAKEGAVEFAEVFRVLKSEPFGLRTGYLSLLYAWLLIPYKKTLIISSHGVEQELTVDLFEELVRRPQDYKFTITSLSDEELDYLDSLQHLFADHIDESMLGRNRAKAIYDGIVSHYKQVPKFARTTDCMVSDECKNYRKLIEKGTTNYSGFLLETLKGMLSWNEVISRVSKAKSELEGAINQLVTKVHAILTGEFGIRGSVTLGIFFKGSYETTWKGKRKKAFDYYTNAFLSLVESLTGMEDDHSIIARLAKDLTGLELVYWNDSTIDDFAHKITDVKKTLDDYDPSAKEGKETQLKLVSPSGDERIVSFEQSELSSLGQTMKNKIQSTFQNYGMSVSYEEKLQILLSILNDTMGGKQ